MPVTPSYADDQRALRDFRQVLDRIASAQHETGVSAKKAEDSLGELEAISGPLGDATQHLKEAAASAAAIVSDASALTGATRDLLDTQVARLEAAVAQGVSTNRDLHQRAEEVRRLLQNLVEASGALTDQGEIARQQNHQHSRELHQILTDARSSAQIIADDTQRSIRLTSDIAQEISYDLRSKLDDMHLKANLISISLDHFNDSTRHIWFEKQNTWPPAAKITTGVLAGMLSGILLALWTPSHWSHVLWALAPLAAFVLLLIGFSQRRFTKRSTGRPRLHQS